MQIVKKGIVPDSRYKRNGGMRVQIEDWSEDYSHCKPADMLAAYPLAKHSRPAIWTAYYPEEHHTFRLELKFDSKEAAERAFDDLVNGRTALLDYKENMTHPEYVECI